MYLQVWQTLRSTRYSWTAVLVNDPSNHVSKPRECLDRMLGIVVVPRNTVVIKKREQLVPILFEPLLALSLRPRFGSPVF